MTDTGAVTAPAAERGAVCLLYVDAETDEAVLETLRTASDAYEVRTCSTVSEALSTLSTDHIDAIVSEYTLPDGDGVDLLRTVRDRHPDLPFLLVTDDGDESVASAAIDAGVTDYVPKGSGMELTRRVAEALTTHGEQRMLLDRMTDAFFAVDTTWQFTYVNEEARAVLNEAMEVELSAEEFLGRTLWEELPSVVDTQFYDEYQRAMTQQTPVSFEAYYEPIATWFEVRAFPSQTGLSVYFRDVTERKRRESQLTEREQVLKDVYRVISDKSTDFEGKVDELLAIGRRVLGAESAALSRIEGDEYIFEIVHDDSIEPGDTVPLSATNCERAVLDEETLVLADVEADAPELTEKAGFTEMGIACYLGTPVWVDGEVYGTFCFYDREARSEPFEAWTVTLVELLGNWVSYEREREHRERELTRERNRLSDFASLVSHDVRNPLNVATGRLELVESDDDADHVAAAMSALDRIDELIEDMLTLSRLGDGALDTEWVAVETIATDAWETVETGEGTLTVESSGRLVADAGHLRQLFENLFRNAVEHGTGAPAVRVGLLDDTAGFYVADDGPGIPTEDRQKVFQSGYTTSDTGTGFGLRIASEITEAHGWHIAAVESERGGARFEVTGTQVE
jgi:signal transduction histidine kinase